ncbi:hypothetical protein ACQKWADRAFT_205055 [Trichoderma austrokoningii]
MAVSSSAQPSGDSSIKSLSCPFTPRVYSRASPSTARTGCILSAGSTVVPRRIWPWSMKTRLEPACPPTSRALHLPSQARSYASRPKKPPTGGDVSPSPMGTKPCILTKSGTGNIILRPTLDKLCPCHGTELTAIPRGNVCLLCPRYRPDLLAEPEAAFEHPPTCRRNSPASRHEEKTVRNGWDEFGNGYISEAAFSCWGHPGFEFLPPEC